MSILKKNRFFGKSISFVVIWILQKAYFIKFGYKLKKKRLYVLKGNGHGVDIFLNALEMRFL